MHCAKCVGAWPWAVLCSQSIYSWRSFVVADVGHVRPPLRLSAWLAPTPRGSGRRCFPSASRGRRLLAGGTVPLLLRSAGLRRHLVRFPSRGPSSVHPPAPPAFLLRRPPIPLLVSMIRCSTYACVGAVQEQTHARTTHTRVSRRTHPTPHSALTAAGVFHRAIQPPAWGHHTCAPYRPVSSDCTHLVDFSHRHEAQTRLDAPQCAGTLIDIPI
jgi:hypothetical protein